MRAPAASVSLTRSNSASTRVNTRGGDFAAPEFREERRLTLARSPARRRRRPESTNCGRNLAPPKTCAEAIRGRFHWGRGRRRPKLAARGATGPIRPLSREIAAKNSGCLRFFGRGPSAAPRPCRPLTAAPCARRPTTRPPLTLGNVTGQRRPPSQAGCCKTTANGWVASRVSFYLSSRSACLGQKWIELHSFRILPPMSATALCSCESRAKTTCKHYSAISSVLQVE